MGRIIALLLLAASAQAYTIQGNLATTGPSFTVGGSSFTVTSGSATVAYGLHAQYFYGNGAAISGIPGVISGGTTNAIPVWTSPTNIGSSHIFDVTSPVVTTSMTVQGSAFSVSGSTFVIYQGYIGQGTSSPQAQLHLSQRLNPGTVGLNPTVIFQDQTGSVGDIQQIAFDAESGDAYYPVVVGSSITSSGGATIADFFVAVASAQSSQPIDRIHIQDTTGNIGIGTVSPAATLDDNSSIANSGSYYNASGAQLNVANSNAAGYSAMVFSGASTATITYGANGAYDRFAISPRNQTGQALVMDQNGNVGVRFSPTQVIASTANLQVAGNASVTGILEVDGGLKGPVSNYSQVSLNGAVLGQRSSTACFSGSTVTITTDGFNPVMVYFSGALQPNVNISTVSQVQIQYEQDGALSLFTTYVQITAGASAGSGNASFSVLTPSIPPSGNHSYCLTINSGSALPWTTTVGIGGQLAYFGAYVLH